MLVSCNFPRVYLERIISFLVILFENGKSIRNSMNRILEYSLNFISIFLSLSLGCSPPFFIEIFSNTPREPFLWRFFFLFPCHLFIYFHIHPKQSSKGLRLFLKTKLEISILYFAFFFFFFWNEAEIEKHWVCQNMFVL